jgi:hypothetical protein
VFAPCRALSRKARAQRKALHMRRADARTRTGDPFITRYGPMSAPVRSIHLRPLSIRLPLDWSGLEVTGDDNLVDGWWTSRMLSP